MQIKTPFFKVSKFSKKTLKRFFIQNEDSIEYFVKEDDKKAKKKYKVETCQQFIQHKDDKDFD